MPSHLDIKNYWETHPLFSYELKNVGSEAFFDEIDKIKRNDVERFALPYWQFDRFQGKYILDVGCGPGWLTVQYALGQAKVTAIDLTTQAVLLTKKYLQYKNLNAEVKEANAEDIPCKDNAFDLVVSSGVLHHTANIVQALRECYRVLKPGRKAKITLYHKGILLSKNIFPITRRLMQIFRVRHPGADLCQKAKNVDAFVRMYDGEGNLVGIAKNAKDWTQILKSVGFVVEGYELHYFPLRFVPLGKFIPKSIHKILDKYFGTMIYFQLSKL